MAVYHIESITIRDNSVIPVRVQAPAVVKYQSTHEVTGDQEIVTYTGDALGLDQSSYFLRMRLDDGTTVDLRNSDIVSLTQEYDVEAGSIIYWGTTAPNPLIGKVSDVYFSKNGDCYSKTEIGWVLQTNIRGAQGVAGHTPTIGDNDNWFINGKDTGFSARGEDGSDGSSPVIDPVTKHWMLNGTDLGVCAEGQTPYIGANGSWWIGTTDTGVSASGAGALPVIDPTSKHWIVDGTDTGIVAEGVDGKTPTIEPTSKHWFIDGVDTGILAEGVGTVANLTINSTTNNWEIDGVDTGVAATGPQGPAGKDGKDGESFQLYAVYESETEMDNDEPSVPENSFVALITSDNVKLFIKKGGYVPDSAAEPDSRPNFVWIKNLTDIVQIAGTPGKDGQTPYIDPTSKHWMIGNVDTGVSAEPLIPYIGQNNNWWVGVTDTGKSAIGATGTTPHIDPISKHWMIGTFDTGVIAEALLPSISSTTNNWVINGVDTGITAKGRDGSTVSIGSNGNWWIDNMDTGVTASGTSGTTPHIDPTSKHWMIGTTDTGVLAEGTVDLDDLNKLKNRLNSLIASKHSLGSCDYFFAHANTGGDINVGANTGSLLQFLPVRNTNMETKGDYVVLRANHTYKITANFMSSSTSATGYVRWRVTDRNGNRYGTNGSSGALYGWTDIESCAVVSFDDDTEITVSIYEAIRQRLTSMFCYVFIEEINTPKDIDPVEYIMHNDGIEDNPVGTIIPYMGNVPPKHYLACDGSVLNIDDYPELAAHFTDEFGAAEYFGGDGITTFAVPDLRGEFLRGTGTADRRTGTGAEVGEHQDGTAIPEFVGYNRRIELFVENLNTNNAMNTQTLNKDSTVIGRKSTIAFNPDSTSNIDYSAPPYNNTIDGKFTTRPTNTAVLYCIKYERTPFLQIGNTNSSDISKDADNQLEQRPDGLYVPKSLSDISKESGNLIELKSDGIFADVPISADDDNALEKKTDGFYVENVPERLRLKVNMLARAKHMTDEVQFFFATSNFDCNEHPELRPTLNSVTDVIALLPDVTTNMDMSDDKKYVRLLANRTYMITSDIMLNSSTSKSYDFDIVDDKGVVYGARGADHESIGWSVGSPTAVITPEEDMWIGVCVSTGRHSWSSGHTVKCATDFTYVFIQEINNAKEIDPIEYIMGQDGIEASPVGSIISYMGNTPPAHYLACDGTEYQISDYAQLAQHFIDEFGSVNYFGGDGIDTFKVPDLRGEFLRGTGTSTWNSGTGGEVGEHQTPTRYVGDSTWSSGNNQAVHVLNWQIGSKGASFDDADTQVKENMYYRDIGYGAANGQREATSTFTGRPTNTAVLYCIKYESTPFVQIGENTSISKDPGNQLEKREDGIYVPDQSLDISKDPENLIEEKSDGIFVDVPISENENNGLKKQEDGFYVENVPERLRLQVNLLETAKHTTREVGFFYAYDPTRSTQVNCPNSGSINIIPNLTGRVGNLEISNDGFVKLLAGKSYWITGMIVSDIDGGIYNIMDRNGSIIGSDGNFTINGTNNAEATGVITPTADTEIGLFYHCGSAQNGKSIYCRNSYLFVQEINNQKTVDPVSYVMGTDGIEASPVGNIISYIGNVPPKHYLACDGTEYSIVDYPQLAQHFIDEFGSVSYFGGDGVDTFCVPDLRGEFLRGTGENSREGQGSGSNVGEHQNATTVPFLSTRVNTDGSGLIWFDKARESSNNDDSPVSVDTTAWDDSNNIWQPCFKSSSTASSSAWGATHVATSYSTRPTNTSVLYCIKYESTPFAQFTNDAVGIELNEVIADTEVLATGSRIELPCEPNKRYDELSVSLYNPTTGTIFETTRLLTSSDTNKVGFICTDVSENASCRLHLVIDANTLIFNGVTTTGDYDVTNRNLLIHGIKYTKVNSDGSTVLIDPDSTNAIEERAGGLYVPNVKEFAVSSEPGNAIIENEDGAFVQDNTDEIENISDRVDAIKKYQRYVNTTLEFCDLTVSNATATATAINQPFIFNKCRAVNDMEYDLTDGSITLKADKSYEIIYDIYCAATSMWMLYGLYDATGDDWLCSTMLKVNNNFTLSTAGTTTGNAIVTPKYDMKLQVRAKKASSGNSQGTDENGNGNSHFTVKEIGRTTIIDPVEWAMKDGGGIEDNPVGMITPYMGETPPRHYLACDGSEYNITDYPYLAEHFREQFGSVSHFGGDGVDTFKVPDLRGEFLRGTGTADRGAGSGADIGEHQDGTVHPYVFGNQSGALEFAQNAILKDRDTTKTSSSGSLRWIDTGTSVTSGNVAATHGYTSRPTNTSVLWCIKAEPTPFFQIGGTTPIEISKDTDNQIEEREDGLYVPKSDIDSVSADNGNIAEIRDDGLYVPEVTEYGQNTRRIANFARTAKLSKNENLDYLYATSFDSITVNSLTFGTPVNLFKTVCEESGISMDIDTGIVQVYGGKTYEVSAKLGTTFGSLSVTTQGQYAVYIRKLGEETWSRVGKAGLERLSVSPSQRFLSSAVAIVTPDVDSEISIQYVSDDTESAYASRTNITYGILTEFKVKEIGRTITIDPTSYVIDTEGIEDSPVGNIISYMGNSVPKHYLACDGAEYAIAEYPHLAEHFRLEFGSVDFFGGDGVDTFKVPDLRGEFLRGAGGNSHQHQGSGGDVGVHQNATAFPNYSNSGYDVNGPLSLGNVTNPDTTIGSTNKSFYAKSGEYNSPNRMSTFTSRPTNTSVLWCIKAEPTPFVQTGGVNAKISKDEGNKLEQREDGLYVANNTVKVSAESDNAIVQKEDGLYVASETTYTDEEIEAAVMDIFYPTTYSRVEALKNPPENQSGTTTE